MKLFNERKSAAQFKKYSNEKNEHIRNKGKVTSEQLLENVNKTHAIS